MSRTYGRVQIDLFARDVTAKKVTHLFDSGTIHRKPGVWYFPPYFYVRCLYGPPWSSPNKPAVGEHGPWFIMQTTD